MRLIRYIVSVFILASLVSFELKANDAINTTEFETNLPQPNRQFQNDKDSLLIKSVYDKFVFAIDNDGKDNPADYFTINALKKLQDEYEFDCEDESCYAYYALRTTEQDSNPDAEDVSRICNIESIDDGWYIVTYLDMGWSGMTRIKIVDGKVDDYQRCISD